MLAIKLRRETNVLVSLVIELAEELPDYPPHPLPTLGLPLEGHLQSLVTRRSIYL